MADIGFLLDLEHRVWQALADGDAATDATLLAPEFLGVYATGFADRAAHTGQLADGPTVSRFALSDARLVPLGEGRALLAYRAEYVRVGASTPEVMYVSSIWENHGGRWRNTFSQDTAEDDAAPV
ncbi:MAG: nuclear transport factor 2 family protein [Rhodobacter sp.]|nr:nuclear transport factor 2 family protein [Rhodobacter sp.]